MSSRPWFKCYPSDWLRGTRKLDPYQRGVYWDLCCLIYEAGGPIEDDETEIASELRITKRKWRAVRDALIKAGKLHVVGGRLSNKRAEKVINSCQNERKNRSEAAKKRGENAPPTDEKPNKNNTTDAGLLPQKSHSGVRPEVRSQKETGTNVPDASKPASDARADLFNGVLTWLGKTYKKPPNNFRPTVGKWLKALDDDADELLAICRYARDENIADPLGYIYGACKAKASHGMVPISEITNTLIERNKRFDA